MRHSILVFALWIAACGGTTTDSVDQPGDDEHGRIDWGKADDNSVVRPGTREAEAVLDYANQPLANQTDGVVFLTELDTELNRRSAESIVEARAGADGTFGTADDGRFSSLDDLDALPWVGRGALRQLFVLAEANGFFVTTAPCDGVAGNHFSTLAQLVELENSGCDHFVGDVTIDVSGTILPAHRTLKAFDAVREIGGQLVVGRNRALEVVRFANLEVVGEIATNVFEIGGRHVEFPNLTKAKILTIGERTPGPWNFDALEEVESLYVAQPSGDFPQLRRVRSMRVQLPEVTGFDALEFANLILIDAETRVSGFRALVEVGNLLVRSDGPRFQPFVVEGFDALERGLVLGLTSGQQRLRFGGFPSLVEAEVIELTGSDAVFPSLVRVDRIDTNTTVTFGGSFPALREVETVRCHARLNPFPALERVTGDFTLQGSGTMGASRLEEVGGFMMVDGALSEYESLRRVGGWLELRVDSVDWDGMRRLERVGRSVSVTCLAGSMDGFDQLSHVGSDLALQVTSCAATGFDSLEQTTNSLTLELLDANALFDGLPLLDRVRNLRFHTHSSEPLAVLPSLTLVDGTMNLRRSFEPDLTSVTNEALFGLDALETVNENVTIADANGIGGLGSLTTIGGDLLVLPRNLPVAAQDAFLDQLLHFSGQIEVR